MTVDSAQDLQYSAPLTRSTSQLQASCSSALRHCRSPGCKRGESGGLGPVGHGLAAAHAAAVLEVQGLLAVVAGEEFHARDDAGVTCQRREDCHEWYKVCGQSLRTSWRDQSRRCRQKHGRDDAGVSYQRREDSHEQLEGSIPTRCGITPESRKWMKLCAGLQADHLACLMQHDGVSRAADLRRAGLSYPDFRHLAPLMHHVGAIKARRSRRARGRGARKPARTKARS